MEKMKSEMKGELVIIKIDADKNQQLAQQLKIEGLPTLILYKKGEEVWKNLGYISEEDLKKKL
jgi:thioredoxin-like negative regulator of GroEL